jgi:hypothetical protein
MSDHDNSERRMERWRLAVWITVALLTAALLFGVWAVWEYNRRFKEAVPSSDSQIRGRSLQAAATLRVLDLTFRFRVGVEDAEIDPPLGAVQQVENAAAPEFSRRPHPVEQRLVPTPAARSYAEAEVSEFAPEFPAGLGFGRRALNIPSHTCS